MANDERDRAAKSIQQLWRKRNHLATEKYMNAETRWDDAIKRAQLAVDREAAANGQNSPRKRWKRSVAAINSLQDGNEMLSHADTGVHGEADVKVMETQHWLELIDGKHRYGSNLKWYHRRWCEEDTEENFFKWLDHGGGQSLSLDQCPRDQLEKERIKYLSVEERLNYLVNIDERGKLRWARNNELVDTSAGHWKDGDDGQGIIAEDDPDAAALNSTSLSDHDEDNAVMHYAGETKGRYPWTRSFRRYFTLRGIVNNLLRKTVKRNTWIYVSDKNFNLFIGIKETGSFQHSSLIGGGLVTSAGLISVKKGVIHTLSPLSGHYRTSVDHFHRFIDVMTVNGVDMHKVKVSKAEAALWGVERIAKVKKAQGELVGNAKEEVKKVIETAKGSDGGWKKEILEGRRQREPQTTNKPEQAKPAPDKE